MIAKLERSGMMRTTASGSRLLTWCELSMMNLTIRKPVTIGVGLSESWHKTAFNSWVPLTGSNSSLQMESSARQMFWIAMALSFSSSIIPTIVQASSLTGSLTATILLTVRAERRHTLYSKADCSTLLNRAVWNVCNRYMPTCLEACMNLPGR